MTHQPNMPQTLKVHVGNPQLDRVTRQLIARRSEAEAARILAQHPHHEIWLHMFEHDGTMLALSSRRSNKEGNTHQFVDVGPAPEGLTPRTILKQLNGVATPKPARRKL